MKLNIMEFGILIEKKTEYFAWDVYKSSDIFFKSIADIEESFKKHPEEWRVYLTYEQ